MKRIHKIVICVVLILIGFLIGGPYATMAVFTALGAGSVWLAGGLLETERERRMDER